MKHQFTSRIIAAVFLGTVLGIYLQSDKVKWNRRGLDAFLAHQTYRFNHYVAAPHLTLTIISSVIIALFVFGIFELLVPVVSRIMTLLKLQEKPRPE